MSRHVRDASTFSSPSGFVSVVSTPNGTLITLHSTPSRLIYRARFSASPGTAALRGRSQAQLAKSPEKHAFRVPPLFHVPQECRRRNGRDRRIGEMRDVPSDYRFAFFRQRGRCHNSIFEIIHIAISCRCLPFSLHASRPPIPWGLSPLIQLTIFIRASFSAQSLDGVI